MDDYLRFILFVIVVSLISFLSVAISIAFLYAGDSSMWLDIMRRGNQRIFLLFWFGLLFVYIFVVMFIFAFFYDRMG